MKKTEIDPTIPAPWINPQESIMTLKEIVTMDADIMAMEDEKKMAMENYVDKEHPLQIGDVVVVNTFRHEGKEMRVTNRGMMLNRKLGGRIKGYRFWATGDILRTENRKLPLTGLWRGNYILYLYEKADLDTIADEPETLTGTEAKRRVDEHFNKIAQDDHGE